MGDEADRIGWIYDSSDFDKEETELDRFMEYHDIDEQDYQVLGSNQLRQMWWNFRKFGK
jgi:hypothetical protein